MIAVDTNILIHAHRSDSPWHSKAASCVKDLAEGNAGWTVPWPCVHEFLSKVTHPRIFSPPSAAKTAFAFLEALLASPTLSLLSEAPDHLTRLSELVRAGRIDGARVHDARIAAICLSQGVSELWTADRDFSRFPALRVRNPLVE